MEKFVTTRAVAVPLDLVNIDTDQIIPARFLKKPKGPEYREYCFHDMRLNDDGTERADFILNDDRFRDARIIVANTNFACGSSRESAVYALQGRDIVAAIAPSFGDIFAANSLKNGLLPIRLADDVVADLRRQLHAAGDPSMTIDLENQEVTAPDGTKHHFDIDPFNRHCILNGLGEIDLTLQRDADISAFDAKYRDAYPWYFG